MLFPEYHKISLWLVLKLGMNILLSYTLVYFGFHNKLNTWSFGTSAPHYPKYQDPVRLYKKLSILKKELHRLGGKCLLCAGGNVWKWSTLICTRFKGVSSFHWTVTLIIKSRSWTPVSMGSPCCLFHNKYLSLSHNIRISLSLKYNL